MPPTKTRGVGQSRLDTHRTFVGAVPPSEPQFNLRAEVYAVMQETDLAAPDEIAAKVAESVSADHLRLALRQALVEYVRDQLAYFRAGASAPKSYHPSPSAKVKAIRDAAPGWLRDRVFVGPNGWRLIGDCSVDDLHYLVADRAARAIALRATADRYDALAELCIKHKAAKVADLPAKVLASFGTVQDAA